MLPNTHFTHCDEAATQQQLPLPAGWGSLCNSTSSTQLLHFNQQWPDQHQHGVSISLSAPSLQQHHAQQLGLRPQLSPDLSAVLLCQPLPAQQQQQSQHFVLAHAASSTAEGSEGHTAIPSSESSVSQSPSIQLSSAQQQHGTPTAGQLRRTTAPPTNSSMGCGPTCALRKVQSSSSLKHAPNRSSSKLFGGSRVRGSSSAARHSSAVSTSTGEAMKEFLLQAIVHRQQQQQQQQPTPGEEGAIRQRLLAALGATTAQRVSTHPQQQQPATPSAMATAGQLLELIADQVSPVVAASMRQRILQELQDIAEDAAAAGMPFDLESETRHILPQLQQAAATAIRMKQQAAAAAAAAAVGAGSLSAAPAAAAVPQRLPVGTQPAFSTMQQQLNSSCAAAAALGSVPIAHSSSDAQLAALLESALTAAAGAASPAASGHSHGAAPALMAAPDAARSALLPGAHARRSPGRAASPSPEVLKQQPGSSLTQLLLLGEDLDADQLRGSNKRQRVAPGKSCSSSSMMSWAQQHSSPALPAAVVGGVGASYSHAQHLSGSSLSPKPHSGSYGGLAGMQEVRGSNPAAVAAFGSFDIEQLLQDEVTAAMLEQLGGGLAI